MSAKSTPYRFKPRFVGVAFVSLSIGVVLIAASATLTPDRFSSIFALITGAAGVFLSFTYLRSPVWRLSVDIQESALVIWSGTEEKLRLPWSDVTRVVMDPDREVCFVDGGSPDRSLLVPGPAAPASYVISKRDKLIDAILAHVPKDIITNPDDVDPASLVSTSSDSKSSDPKSSDSKSSDSKSETNSSESKSDTSE
tara:strand:+ start:39051 stop:39641 length:591 start_codon:yes stop_codon:yes gene_type:complete